MRTITIPTFGSVVEGQGGRLGAIMRGPAAEGSQDYAIIVPDAEGAEIEAIAWSPEWIKIEGADSKTDGAANTAAMAKADLALGKRIAALNLHGHQDWHLPAMAELQALHATVPELFSTEDWYWSSTQSSRSIAWCQDFEYGCSDSFGKDVELRARPVRKIPLSHFNP